MEIWKSIKGYEGIYEVSNYGRIKSLSRITSNNRRLKEKIINGGYYPNGYKLVCLRKNGINKNHLIHRLVAEAFILNPNNYSVVNHLDGNKKNNHVSNLEWCTQSDNLKHAIEIGMIDSQCKIRREVTISKNNTTIVFESMKGCASFFGFEKGWLHNRMRKHGNPFKYNGWHIRVHDRGDVENGKVAIL